MNKQTYSVPEVAEILGIGRNSAYEAANRGDFPTIKVGGRTLIPKARFHRWLEEVRIGGKCSLMRHSGPFEPERDAIAGGTTIVCFPVTETQQRRQRWLRIVRAWRSEADWQLLLVHRERLHANLRSGTQVAHGDIRCHH